LEAALHRHDGDDGDDDVVDMDKVGSPLALEVVQYKLNYCNHNP
jgi:hypothetical protein